MTERLEPEVALAELNTAIHNYLVSREFLGDGEFVGDWTAVVNIPAIHPDGLTNYAQINSSTRLPAHVQFGLLQAGLWECQASGGRGTD